MTNKTERFKGDEFFDSQQPPSNCSYEEFIEHFESNQSGYQKMFEDISKLTPEFSGEDWFKLYWRASYGDYASMLMLMSLWERKINPHLPEEFHPNFKGLDDHLEECL